MTELDLAVPNAGEEILVSIETPFVELSASISARAIVDELRVE